MTRRYDTPEMAALWSEPAKFQSWLLVEKTVALVQGELGLIPVRAAQAIQRATFSIPEIDRFEKTANHDVVAFTRSVARSAGPAGKYVHYGLTSYDVVDTALSLRCVSALEILSAALGDLRLECARLALEHRHTPMIGRTHGVHAEPITFGLKCLSWHQETDRSLARLAVCEEEVRHGKLSGTVGAYALLGPKVEARVLRRLGLSVEPVSTQVIPRDRHAHLLSSLALCATGLERIATEVRNLQRTEIAELAEPFARGQRGSSAMPHKKNPIVCERVTSLARVIRGYALTGMENVALWHERDLSNSAAERIIMPDSFTLLHYITRKLTAVLRGLVVRPDRMLANLEASGQVFFSQSVMLALVRAGMNKDAAYELVQSLAFRAGYEGVSFPDLCRASPEVTCLLTPRALAQAVDIRRLLRHTDSVYRRVGLAAGIRRPASGVKRGA
jgi:adenylosuccinate lyase